MRVIRVKCMAIESVQRLNARRMRRVPMRPYDATMNIALVAATACILLIGGCSNNESTQKTRGASVTPNAQTPAQTDDVPTDGASANEHKYTNRLINETSPYLLQHAHNPVDWYPWGEEAFEAAREQNKPIFLSVGYSTCYWCHVMERESFENEEIAAIMNENFINIKVDREERPDIDDIYMAAVQITTNGAGGWPMSVFLEPTSLRPFFAGTYYPPDQERGMVAFPTILRSASSTWKNQPDQLLQQAGYLADAVGRSLAAPRATKPLNSGLFELAATQIMRGYDETYGGFSNPPAYAPKFPMPTHIDLLMAAQENNDIYQPAVKHSLGAMAMGGIYDQIGGGFHRYSTDRKWLVPHFEKMLYDNGQLASTYAAAYRRNDDEYFARVIRQTLDYVLREMTDAGGGFYSAQDAEVDGREGLNYLWQPDEVRQALTDAGLESDIDLVFTAFGLNEPANFHDPHHPDEPRRHVLYLTAKPDDLARQLNISVEDFYGRLDRARAALLDVRSQRKQPRLDDKIIVSWNGLMIAGFADGGAALNEQKYIDAAARAAEFILNSMRTEDGGLLRTYRAGETNVDAFFEDYAHFIHGLLALHAVTNETKWLDAADTLAIAAKQRFWDDDHGGYFDTLADQSDLFVRTRSMYDGASPSGTSVMINNLITLADATGKEEYRNDAAATLRSISGVIATAPASAAVAVNGMQRYLAMYPADLLQPPVPEGPVGQTEIVTMSFMDSTIPAESTDTTTIDMTLTIAPGWHITANEPGADFAVPLKVEMIGATGVELDVQYPKSQTFTGPIGTLQVYSSSVTIPLHIKRTGEVSGNAQLVITWQACDGTKCLAPERSVWPLSWTGE